MLIGFLRDDGRRQDRYVIHATTSKDKQLLDLVMGEILGAKCSSFRVMHWFLL